MKQVILENNEIKKVPLKNIDRENVYILFTTWGAYKAQRIAGTLENDKWAFINLSNSYTYSNGVFGFSNTLEDLIKATLEGGEKVYEFNDFREVVDAINTGALYGII